MAATNPKIIAVQAKADAPPPAFHARELWRLIRVCSQYRGLLLIGLALTVVFACFHTASVGTAFPVFKILLEEEGARGWTNRVIAGERLGLTFAPFRDERMVIVAGIDPDGPAAAAGVHLGDGLTAQDGAPCAAWLAQIADAESGASLAVQAHASGDTSAAPRALALRVDELDTADRMLHRAASWFLPASDANKLETLTRLLIALLVVVVVANVFRYFGEIYVSEAVLRAMLQLRSQLYERTLQLPLSFFAGQDTSDIVGRFVQDIQEIQRGMITLFSKFIREPLRALFVLGFALFLDWRLTLTVVVVTPVVVAIFWRVGKSVKKSNRKLLQAYGVMIGALTASLQNLRVVKAYTAEQRERARLRDIDLRVFKQQLKLARLQAMVSPTMETIAIVAISVLTLWLAQRVLAQELEISRFATLGIALSLLFDPLRKLSDVYVRVMRSTAGAERIFQVIDHPIEADLSPATIELQPLTHAIEFDHVTFAYPGAEQAAVRDVHLTITRGETVAIVGPNGSGKTTLVSMLPRFFDPGSGRILYDGQDIRTATLASLRRQIGLVTQDAVIFAGTPQENIAYGQNGQEPGSIVEAARRAYADEFIRQIPGEYEARLGERGTTLSGGQRQRMAIARAIFRNAPILIFDEATSQIDSESELKIQSALREFARGRTTIIIAHRLSTIQFADRIVVMDNGRILDIGTHRELFERCGLYRTLCETQFVTEPTAT